MRRPGKEALKGLQVLVPSGGPADVLNYCATREDVGVSLPDLSAARAAKEWIDEISGELGSDEKNPGTIEAFGVCCKRLLDLDDKEEIRRCVEALRAIFL